MRDDDASSSGGLAEGGFARGRFTKGGFAEDGFAEGGFTRGGFAQRRFARGGFARGRFAHVRAAVRTPVGACSAALLALLIALTLFAPLLWGGRAAAIDTDALQQGPTGAHWLGTDGLGRDILARVLVATRLSIELAVAATAIGVAAGTLLGTAPAVLPRWAGRLVTSAVNVAVAFPGLLLALFFAMIFGVGGTGAVLAIGLAMAPAFARLTQTLSAAIAGRDFVAAARVAGVGRVRLLVRHVLPNIGEPLVVNATISAGMALLTFAGLSFLGIGVQAPAYDWGRLLGQGLNQIYVNPTAALAPGVAVVVAGLAFNLFGETVAGVVGARSAAPARLKEAPPQAASAQAPPSARVEDDDGGRPVDAEGGDRPVRSVPSVPPVLVVEDLRVAFPGPSGPVTPVRGVSFTIGAGESVGVVGESGSGKSLTALAISRLIEAPGVVSAARLDFLGTPLLRASDADVRALLGTSMALVFQDPMTSFNPTQRIGRQLAEVSRQHHGLSRGKALARAVERLRAVRVPAAERRAHQYPHEFSGGMRQRAMIAMGLMGEPRLVIADEPTTALDVTVQRQVLRLLARVRAEATEPAASSGSGSASRTAAAPTAGPTAGAGPTAERKSGSEKAAAAGSASGAMAPAAGSASDDSAAPAVDSSAGPVPGGPSGARAVRSTSAAALLLISHDITVVAQSCHRVLVMYAGRIVEDLPADGLRGAARHPYTRALLAAVPALDTDRDAPLAVIPGRPPEPGRTGAGCAFAARCAFADERCRTEEPMLVQVPVPVQAGIGYGHPARHRVACWHPQDGSGGEGSGYGPGPGAGDGRDVEVEAAGGGA
ncbi:dipeptide/oligopeptide/nickel ABC transporter permease/ATP-binding protein [Streptomyces varsoviensis]|uniref:dipeptide/oligopeptide/nickel ABC transporter permease/ATP-binding protein n=1 Tax=Streptomyces varsoviensis TaxID=67373 RepID=UPI0033EB8359